MKSKVKRVVCIGTCTAMLAACSAEQQSQGLGALIGAAGGAATGALASGGDTKAILAGAAGGAVVGWAAVKLTQYHAQQTRSAQEEAKAFGYTSSEGTVVRIRGITVSPQEIKGAQTIALNTDYSVLAPSQDAMVPVTESFELWKDNQLVTKLGTQVVTRAPGGWNAAAEIPMPAGVAAGTYVVKTRVEGAGSNDVREAHFVVTG